MIGIRSWEVVGGDKLQKCDLLEVYNENEKSKLKKINGVELAKLAPDALQEATIGKSSDEDLFEFSNIDQSATENIIQEMAIEEENNEGTFRNIIMDDEAGEISIDDI